VTEISVNDIYEDKIDSKTCAFICHRTQYYQIKKMLTNIPIFKVEDAKGLEFNTVYVSLEAMSINEMYIAFSRAMQKLIIVSL
jgi:DNA helicase IV